MYTVTMDEGISINESIPMVLQSLFYKMQHQDKSVSAKSITRSFGCDIHDDSFLQYDVRQFNRFLFKKPNHKMKVHNFSWQLFNVWTKLLLL
jgi:ubiquitin carboxyl-terminal hydrolase 7